MWTSPLEDLESRQEEERKRKWEGENVRSRKLVETELYVPFMPGSLLKKEMLQAIKVFSKNPDAGKVRVDKRVSSNLAHILCNPASWKDQPCRREACPSYKEKPGDCLRRNVNYRIDCLECKEVGDSSTYWGESLRTHFDRQLEHVKMLKTMKEESPLFRHWQENLFFKTENFALLFMAVDEK